MDIFSTHSNISTQKKEEPKIILPEDNFKIERVIINEKRHYKVQETDGTLIGTFPSVTSVLGSTKDQSGLDKWRNRVGHEAAEKIGKDATERGTVMHRLCELYCTLPSDMSKEEKLSETLELSRQDEEINQFDARAIIVGSQLFYNFYNTDFFSRIKYSIAQEKFLWTKIGGGYAGTFDNLSMMDDNLVKVVDFKTAKKPKDEKYIEDYKRQGAAYSIAIWDRYGIKPRGVEIWISNEKERFPQCYTMNENDIKHYFKLFLERLKQFQEQIKGNI